MQKAFDCVQMKRDAQEQIYLETRALDRAAEIAYFHEAGVRFQHEINALRARHTEIAREREDGASPY